MSRKKRPKPLYQRGPFALYRRADRPNLEIVWYDAERKRERSVSTGSSDVGYGRKALDRKYLDTHGTPLCPHCQRPMEGDAAPFLTQTISDYLILSEGKAGYNSTRTRLALVVRYVAETNAATTVPMATEAWVNKFRNWMAEKGYSLGHTEGCVLQLAAAINSTKTHKAPFKARPVKEVAKSPVFRASVEQLAEMFRFCIDPPSPDGREWSDKERAMVVKTRENLLRYLRAAVATWSRPDAILDLKAKGQWVKEAGILNLNAPGRRQTKKYRPMVPVPQQFAPWLDEAMDRESYIPVSTIRHAWDAMAKHLGLPGGREAGPKLVRRSMATICRRIIGEAHWAQGEMMLGHRKASTSDIYALPDPANLGKALAATEQVIDQLEAFVPGAFRMVYRNRTANSARLKVVK